jgi:DNA polymerase-3 subunit gamma/tau
MMAAEMAVIRLTHVADLPDPETLVKKLTDSPRPPSGGGLPGGAPAGGDNGGTVHAPRLAPVQSAPTRGPMMSAAAPALAEGQMQVYATFESVVELIRSKRDMLLLNEVESGLRLARYSPGRIEFEPASGAKPDLASRLGQRLQGWTGSRWGVSVVSSGGAPTIAEMRNAQEAEAHAEADSLPLVQAIKAAFPGAKIADVRLPDTAAPAPTLAEVDAELDPDWDPFEE